MQSRALAYLTRRLAEHQRICVGEIAITVGETFQLNHRRDQETTAWSKIAHEPRAALEIAKFDAAGKFRPLKTAPNLPKGWVLYLREIKEVQEALDYFYPGAIAMAAAAESGRLTGTPISETIARQTGMYRIVNRLSLEQRDQLAADVCRSDTGCLRTICWQITPERPHRLLPAEKFDLTHDQSDNNPPMIPLPCPEACNLLIAAGRVMAKKSVPA